MRISKLLQRVISGVIPTLTTDVITHPQLNSDTYKAVAADAVNAVVKALNDEYLAENPHETKPPISITTQK